MHVMHPSPERRIADVSSSTDGVVVVVTPLTSTRPHHFAYSRTTSIEIDGYYVLLLLLIDSLGG